VSPYLASHALNLILHPTHNSLEFSYFSFLFFSFLSPFPSFFLFSLFFSLFFSPLFLSFLSLPFSFSSILSFSRSLAVVTNGQQKLPYIVTQPSRMLDKCPTICHDFLPTVAAIALQPSYVF
jgi:hypothetical protein